MSERSPAEKLLIDFADPGERSRWETVNDRVMGGISQGTITISGDKTAIFQGLLSLENDGGFASVRTLPRQFDLAEHDGLLLSVRGDGKTYRVRLRTDDSYDGVAYQSLFRTEPGVWLTVRLPFSTFVPVFRGMLVPSAPALDPARVRRIGFMIADRQEGSFLLEIAWIKAYVER